ncbi:hypothetical protein [Escherichia coli]|uniref:gp53-like domain-containing protein n=1 Tax=Escherichia coli TaxID=562 RepID=UPI003855F148
MALTLLAANNAQTVLAAGISASATSLTVNSGTGSLFPAPSDRVSFFKLTLIDAATGQLTEIMHVTARTGDTMKIERGQEGTTARAWSANDIAANMMTAGTLNYILANFQPLDATLTALAGLATGANKLPYFTGTDTAAQTDLTSVGRDIIGKGTIADILTYLGLGETINKASGAMQKSANGADISDVSAFRNALQLGTAATRDVGADNASKLLDLDSFRSMMSGNGYIYIPCIATTGNPVKLMLQWGMVATQKGADAGYALPFAFPYAGLFATGNRGTSGYNAAMNVRIASRTHISIQNWSPSGVGTEDCCFIALGY